MAGERDVADHEAHLALALSEERLQRGMGAPAERALKIREEYNRGGARLHLRRGRDLVTDRQRHLRAGRKQGEQREEQSPVADDPDEHARVLQREDAGAHEIREALALILVEDAVDLAERLHHRFAESPCALHALIAALVRALFTEGRALDRVCEGRDRAALIDLCLGALGLQLVEDLRELPGLLFRELELVREKAERTADAEVTAIPGPRRTAAWTEAAEDGASRTTPASRTTTGTSFALRMTGGSPPMNECRMHFCLQLAGAISLPTGFHTWAPCLTWSLET